MKSNNIIAVQNRGPGGRLAFTKEQQNDPDLFVKKN